jgi:hypothetical protein
LREKFAVAFRKKSLEGVESFWPLYSNLTFLEPFVSMKSSSNSTSESETKKKSSVTQSFISSPLDEFALIDVIKEYPILYDKKHEDFRSSTRRNHAWQEVARKFNYDVVTIQKRWRVLRDRFVRELKRTQYSDTSEGLTCSSLFRQLLFLANHVRSKNYEIEAELPSDSKATDSEDESPKELMFEEYQENVNEEKAEEDSIFQCEEVEETEMLEEEEEALQNENIEDEYESIEYEELTTTNSNEGADEIEEIQEQWLKDQISKPIVITNTSRKRRGASSDDDFQEQPKRKIKSASRTTPDVNLREDQDEDMAFGNTIGCMLKKIPAHLKTSVKLKLLSSLAEFEAQNKLV